MQPSVGRIVHYVSYGTPGGEYGSECRAAIITEVNRYAPGSIGDQTDAVGLCVLNPTGQFFNRGTPLDEGKPDLATRPASEGTGLCDGKWHAGGTWHWPARVQ